MTIWKLSTLLSLVLIVGCGGESDEAADPATGDTDTTPTGSNGDDDDDGSVAVDISAAEGGEVSIDGATLTIPAGALAEDTTITAATITPDGSVPDASTVTGLIYDFGPDGLTFVASATLELPVATSPEAGQVLVVSWLDDATGAWVDVPTTDNGGTVTAEIGHFTWFAVRLVDEAGATIECAPFSACGGDPVGAWTFDAVCYDLGPSESPDCPGTTVQFFFQLNEGSLTIDTGGTWSQYVDVAFEIVSTLPPACMGPIASCSELDQPEEGLFCSGDSAVSCTCVVTDTSVSNTQGTWETNGASLTIRPSGDDPDVFDYCVAGNVLQLSQPQDALQYDLSK